MSFTDISDSVGLDNGAPSPSSGGVGAFVGGASLGDYDSDGVVDLFLTRVGAGNRLFRGAADGSFDDVTEASGLGDDGVGRSGGSGASVWADIDGDDDLDLFVGGVGEQADRLYLNQGDGTFSDRSEERGLASQTDPGGSDPTGGFATLGAAFADWDRDGDLDLVTTHWAPPSWAATHSSVEEDRTSLCGIPSAPASGRSDEDQRAQTARSRLFTNDGDGTFSDVTADLNLDLGDVSAFTPVFADYDSDAWPDLFVTGDFCTSRLYRNSGTGGFADVTAQSGLGTDENGMGSVVEDLNGDGILDWFVTSIAPGPERVGCVADQVTVGCSGNRLFLGRGAGGFVDATEQFGVRESAWAWGAAGEDMDNDGRRDLLAVNGYSDAAASATGPGSAASAAFYGRGAPSLWRGSAGGPWVENASALGLVDGGQAKSVIPFDHDGDGDLDLLVGHTTTPAALFRNDLTAGGHWLELRLHDATTSNTNAIGARVRLKVPGKDKRWIGDVRTGSGYQSSGPGTLHIGLGELDGVDAIEVRWPDSDNFERYGVEAVDTTITIERGS
ncbi:MAG: CRTAC1 family protein [Microthrixaceae bacterium]